MQKKPQTSFALVRTLLTCAALAFALSVICSSSLADENGLNIPARKDYAAIAETLKPFVEREMAEKGLPGLSIAIVDDQQIVWAQGFGMADPSAQKPATAQTIYRIGSVSKLFTDIAIMQLVERGELNLDAPITDYLPDFRPRNPFGTAITLRQLMSHRSGLLREPPAGNYFETTEPSLAATVRSLNDTELVFAPNTHTKYSNAAIAVVGYLLEARSHRPFAKYVSTRNGACRKHVFDGDRPRTFSQRADGTRPNKQRRALEAGNDRTNVVATISESRRSRFWTRIHGAIR